MAALLVAMAVMAVLMSVALPVWRHEAQREKEEELVFRGQQYIRAIRLFQQRTQTLPTSVDMLVQGRYLRKKYKDPITGEDFDCRFPPAARFPARAGSRRAGQPAGRPRRARRQRCAVGGRRAVGAGRVRLRRGSSPAPVRRASASSSGFSSAPSPAA